MFPELCNGIKRCVMLKTQSADLKRKWEKDVRSGVRQLVKVLKCPKETAQKLHKCLLEVVTSVRWS